ncbi:MAG: retropepsin-like domain-containing protein [Spirochaetes bacterium]|nr:retropepsin-like domain-containing protein [Spirochaetota bacterium]
MSIDFRAFTTKSNNGFLRELANNIHVLPGASIRKAYNIKNDPIQIKAVWDTGAMTTCISTKFAEKLHLPPIGKTMVVSVHGEQEADVYLIDILLPNKVYVKDVKVNEVPCLLNSDILIGMDIITIGDFAITNAKRTTYFSFRVPPDYKHINYVADAKAIREKHERKKKRKRH